MDWQTIERRKIQIFGGLGFLFFGFFFGYAIFHDLVIAKYFFGILFLFSTGFIIIPTFLKPVYFLWIKTAITIRKVISLIHF